MTKPTSPIQNHLQCVFVPVRDIHAAKAWYDDILGIEDGGAVLHGHLYVVPMEGTGGLVLDAQPNWRGPDGDICPHKAPTVQLATDDIAASFGFMKEKGVELVTEIEHGHWFVFKDPDGNHVMVAQC